MNDMFSLELEQMRSQVEMLKKKLEKQTIINDSHIRNSMKSKQYDMTKTIASTIFVAVLSIPYSSWIFYRYGFSPLFIVATDLMLIICIGITIMQRWSLKKLNFTQGNLVEVAEKLNKVKTHYHEWIKIALPMIISWLSWLIYEVLTKMEPSPMRMGFLTGACVGVIFGGFFGYRINRKIVAKSTEILNQIKELQG